MHATVARQGGLLFLVCDNSGWWTIITDQLVAIRISNVGEIDLSRGPLADAGRVL
jgi:hypothetical protein